MPLNVTISCPLPWKLPTLDLYLPTTGHNHKLSSKKNQWQQVSRVKILKHMIMYKMAKTLLSSISLLKSMWSSFGMQVHVSHLESWHNWVGRLFSSRLFYSITWQLSSSESIAWLRLVSAYIQSQQGGGIAAYSNHSTWLYEDLSVVYQQDGKGLYK